MPAPDCPAGDGSEAEKPEESAIRERADVTSRLACTSPRRNTRVVRPKARIHTHTHINITHALEDVDKHT